MTMVMVSCGSDKKDSDKDDKEKEEEVSKEEQFVRDFEKLADELVKACESGDTDKAMAIAKKVEELGNKADAETNEENYTEEQKERVEKAALKIATAIGGGAYDYDYDDDEEDTTVESYEYDDADYGMSEEDAAALGF